MRWIYGFILFVALWSVVYVDEESSTPSDVLLTTRRILNDSEVASLTQETAANASLTVSNTSIDDLLNDDNATRLRQQHRERNKEVRLQSIKSTILSIRQSRQSNTTLPEFSDTERRSIEETYERLRQSSIIPWNTTTTERTNSDNVDSNG